MDISRSKQSLEVISVSLIDGGSLSFLQFSRTTALVGTYKDVTWRVLAFEFLDILAKWGSPLSFIHISPEGGFSIALSIVNGCNLALRFRESKKQLFDFAVRFCLVGDADMVRFRICDVHCVPSSMYHSFFIPHNSDSVPLVRWLRIFICSTVLCLEQVSAVVIHDSIVRSGVSMGGWIPISAPPSTKHSTDTDSWAVKLSWWY